MAKIVIKDGELSSSAGINIPGSLSVSGNVTIGDVFTDILTVNANSIFNDDLTVLDTISGSNLIISNNSTFLGNIFVSGTSIYGQVAELTSSTTNYTLVPQDSGKFLHISSSSAINLTVPAGLPTGFTVTFCQNGPGTVTVITGSGVVIRNRQSHNKTAGLYSIVSLVSTGSNGYILAGDTSL
jgi:hypothetical protein